MRGGYRTRTAFWLLNVCAANQQGIGNRKFKMYQFREAMRDPFTWAVFFLALASDILNGGLNSFFSLIVVSFGFTPRQSLLYGTPVGAVGAIALIAWSLLSRRFGHRLLWGAASMAVSMIDVILFGALPLGNRLGRLFGFYLTTAFAAGLATILSLISSNVAG